jgi:hypothetical protein
MIKKVTISRLKMLLPHFGLNANFKVPHAPQSNIWMPFSMRRKAALSFSRI